MLLTLSAAEVLARLDDFDTVIDARSQNEFTQDHLPGAVNWPTLDDAERRLVGTEFKELSGFDAKKRGAAFASRNIALHLEREVFDKPKGWQPLVYCWRGGSRSGALAHILGEIGFRVHRLEGGYQQYRRSLIGALDELPLRLSYRVICGTTGSGKSRLLQALRSRGAQVLDLEALANHRGSVLGLVPGETQPGQKRFDTLVWDALRHVDPARPVFIESESKKVGDVRVPAALIERMRASPCLWLELPLEARVALLIEDYDFFVRDTEAFCTRLDALRATRGNDTVIRWQEAARAGRTAEVVRELLVLHYDPVYVQSMQRNFAALAAVQARLQWDGSAASLDTAAAKAIAAG